MTDDTGLSQRLTEVARRTAGVSAVFAAKPAVAAAADALAVALALREPDVLVDVARSEGFTTFTVHIAADAATPAPQTLRAVGEAVRDLVLAEGAAEHHFAVNVKARMIEGLEADRHD